MVTGNTKNTYWFNQTAASSQLVPELDDGFFVQEDRLPMSNQFVGLRIIDARGGLSTAIELVSTNFHPDGSISVNAYSYPPQHKPVPVRQVFELNRDGEIITENGSAARDGQMLGLAPDGTLVRRNRPLSYRSLTRF
jgi:hypothetical protein